MTAHRAAAALVVVVLVGLLALSLAQEATSAPTAEVYPCPPLAHRLPDGRIVEVSCPVYLPIVTACGDCIGAWPITVEPNSAAKGASHDAK